MKINVALFGLGRVGIMHASDISSHPKFNLKYVFDKNQTLSVKASKKFKSDTSDYNSSKIIDLGDKNFLQLKDILSHLDIIFSIDTSLIHLLGILNLKSYLLLNYNSDWRWFNDHEKTIWYSSVTIIKQNKFNNWDNVIKKVKKIINEKIKIKLNE